MVAAGEEFLNSGRVDTVGDSTTRKWSYDLRNFVVNFEDDYKGKEEDLGIEYFYYKDDDPNYYDFGLSTKTMIA